MGARLWPALDVRSAPGVGIDTLEDQILVALDDAPVSAVQELPGGWRFFFAATAGRDLAAAILRQRWPEELSLEPLDVSDEDWAARSQANIGPVRVGRITIAPPWAQQPNAAGQAPAPRPAPSAPLAIVIQPSMGFGTGHHASTRLCTALMQQVDVAGRRVLDVGTGSGVLAIIALRLGADTVLGIDNDADALESARENLALNGIEDGIELRQADFRTALGARFDIVTANLTGGLLVRGASTLADALAPGASLILSGVAVDEESSVRGSFDPRLELRSRLEEDGWVGLRYERAAAASR